MRSGSEQLELIEAYARGGKCDSGNYDGGGNSWSGKSDDGGNSGNGGSDSSTGGRSNDYNRRCNSKSSGRSGGGGAAPAQSG